MNMVPTTQKHTGSHCKWLSKKCFFKLITDLWKQQLNKKKFNSIKRNGWKPREKKKRWGAESFTFNKPMVESKLKLKCKAQTMDFKCSCICVLGLRIFIYSEIQMLETWSVTSTSTATKCVKHLIHMCLCAVMWGRHPHGGCGTQDHSVSWARGVRGLLKDQQHLHPAVEHHLRRSRRIYLFCQKPQREEPQPQRHLHSNSSGPKYVSNVHTWYTPGTQKTSTAFHNLLLFTVREIDNTLTVLIVSVLGGVIGLVIIIMVVKALVVRFLLKPDEKTWVDRWRTKRSSVLSRIGIKTEQKLPFLSRRWC